MREKITISHHQLFAQRLCAKIRCARKFSELYEKRSKILHVSREMIMWKAKIIFDEKYADPAVRDYYYYLFLLIR